MTCAEVVGNHYFLAHGGHEFDGRIISPFDEEEVRGIAAQIRDLGIAAIAVSSVFLAREYRIRGARRRNCAR